MLLIYNFMDFGFPISVFVICYLRKLNSMADLVTFFAGYIYFDMSTQEGGMGIRTSDLRFMRRSPS
jgi:hypothetical protein